MATIAQQQEDDKEGVQQAQGALTQSTGLSGASQAPSTPQRQRQGSGRFTNVQQYLQANQQGGERIGQQIGQKVGGDLEKKQGKAQDYYGKIREGVEGAQTVARQGGNFLQQLQGIGSNIETATGEEHYSRPSQNNTLPSGPVMGSVNDSGLYYGGVGSSGALRARLAGNYDPSRPYSQDHTQYWLNEDEFNTLHGSLPSNYVPSSGSGVDRSNPLSSINRFVESPDFGQFQNIQAGRGIDERLLGAQQADLYGASQAYQQAAQQAQQALGTEGGRFDLLKSTFGGNVNPGYTSGAQRLDQLLLSQQGLGGLQQQVGEDVRSAGEMARQAGLTGQQVGSLASQERDLMGRIGDQTSLNEQNYLNMLSSYVPEAQKQRQAEWQALEDSVDLYQNPDTDKITTPGFTQEQRERLGLTGQERIFDIFKDMQGASDIARKGREIGGYQDVAQQADVDRYAALANIAGIEPQRLTDVSDVGSAYEAREGDQGLKERLNQREEGFNKDFTDLLNRISSGQEDYKSYAPYQGTLNPGQSGYYRANIGQALVDLESNPNDPDAINRLNKAFSDARSGPFSYFKNMGRDSNAAGSALDRLLEGLNINRTVGGTYEQPMTPKGKL